MAEDRSSDPEREARRRGRASPDPPVPRSRARMRANEVESFDGDLARLVERMKELMREANGVGLAGNQVGVLQRVIVLQPDRGGGAVRARQPGPRGGLQGGRHRRRGMPSLQGVTVPVERGLRITVDAVDENGSAVSSTSRASHACPAARGRPPRRRPPPPPPLLPPTYPSQRTTDDTRREALADLRPRGSRQGSPLPSAHRIGVAATAGFGADVLERLADRHDVAFLLTRPDRPAGPGPQATPPPAKGVAERLGIPVLQPVRPAQADLDAETVVLVAYGALIPPELLERHEWLNVHPSLLPRWRGAAPVERAIMAGDEETGASVIRLVEELDAGPIGAQERVRDRAGRRRGRRLRSGRRRAGAGLLEADVVQPRGGRSPTPRRSARRTASSTGRGRPGAARPDPRALAAHRRAAASTGAGDRLAPAARRQPTGAARCVTSEGGKRMAYDAWLRGLRS